MLGFPICRSFLLLAPVALRPLGSRLAGIWSDALRGGRLSWALLLGSFSCGLFPLFGNELSQLCFDVFVVALLVCKWMGGSSEAEWLTRSDLKNRAATSVLTAVSRSAGGFSIFWILSMYCFTRVNSAKMA